MDNELIERFWCNIDLTDGCWPWLGYTLKNGYGYTRCGGRKRILTHRLSWQIFKGPIPKGILVCHTCDNPPCTNPEHLYLGTHADNAADKVAKGRAFGQNKKSCPQGHSYDIIDRSTGHRRCRRCRNESLRVLRIRRKESLWNPV